MKEAPDLIVRYESHSLWLMEAASPAAFQWAEDVLDPETPRWCKQYAIGHGAIADLVERAAADGLRVRVE